MARFLAMHQNQLGNSEVNLSFYFLFLKSYFPLHAGRSEDAQFLDKSFYDKETGEIQNL